MSEGPEVRATTLVLHVVVLGYHVPCVSPLRSHAVPCALARKVSGVWRAFPQARVCGARRPLNAAKRHAGGTPISPKTQGVVWGDRPTHSALISKLLRPHGLISNMLRRPEWSYKQHAYKTKWSYTQHAYKTKVVL